MQPRDHVMHQTALIPRTMQPATDRSYLEELGDLIYKDPDVSGPVKLGIRLLKFWTDHRETSPRLVYDLVVWRRWVRRPLLVHAPD